MSHRLSRKPRSLFSFHIYDSFVCMRSFIYDGCPWTRAWLFYLKYRSLNNDEAEGIGATLLPDVNTGTRRWPTVPALDVGQGRKNFLIIVLLSYILTFSHEILALALAVQKCSRDIYHLWYYYSFLFFLQSKEIICQLQEDLMKLLNELYTVNQLKTGGNVECLQTPWTHELWG